MAGLGVAVVLVVAVALPWVSVTAHVPSELGALRIPDRSYLSYTVSGFGQGYLVRGLAVVVCRLVAGVFGVSGGITGKWLDHRRVGPARPGRARRAGWSRSSRSS